MSPSELHVTVRRFEFTGNTLFTADQLEALLSDFTGRPVALDEIYRAADKVTDYYARHGYTLASAIPPAQSVAGGIVKLQIIEGRIASVGVEGTTLYTADQVRPYLDRITADQIYRQTDLEAGLQRINQLPGLSAKAVLRPGDQFGTSNLLIQGTEQPFIGAAVGDNQGRRNIGRYRGSVSGTFNNPLQLEDQLQLLALHSEENLLNYAYLGYSLPIRHVGLPSFIGPRLSASYSIASFVAIGAGGLDVNGSNKGGRIGLDWPLQSTREEQSSFGIAVSHQDANSDLVGIALPGATHLTLLELSGSYNRVYSSLAVSQLLATISSNFRKASTTGCRPSPTDCNAQLFRLELDAQHLQPIIGRLDGYVHVNLGYSPDPLPPATVYSIGGPNSVRGFAAAEARGDSGHLVSVGLRHGFILGPTQNAARIFVDSGQARYARPLPTGADAQTTLISAGLGGDLSWQISRFALQSHLDLSRKLNSYTPTDSRENLKWRLFGSVAISF